MMVAGGIRWQFFLALGLCWLLWPVAPLSADNASSFNRSEGMVESRGERIAFSSSISGSWQISTVAPDGCALQQVTRNPAECFHPSWAPDGRRLVCADANGDLWIAALCEKTARKLPGLPLNCAHPDWSPDGKKIAFVVSTSIGRKEDSDLWVVELEGGTAWKLFEQAGLQKYPSWSPTGTEIVYSTGYRVSDAKVVEDLWVVKADGTNPRSLLANGFSNIHPAWSPDGARIAFASDRTGSLDIWVMDFATGSIRQLTSDSSLEANPSWSPDGTKMCFSSTRNGKMDLWIMAQDGTGLRQLTGPGDEDSECREPSWSPGERAQPP